MLDEYIKILKALSQHPRMIDKPTAEDVSILQTGRLSPQDLRSAWQRADVQAYLYNGAGTAPEITRHRMVPQTDHPVNRYVLWLSKQLLRSLKREKRSKDAKRLEIVLKRSAFNHLRPEPLSNAALLVLINDPSYAKLHQIALSLRKQSQ